MENTKVITIDRSKWRTGREGPNSSGVGRTSLLNKEGYMCCLGFFCLQRGIEEVYLGGIYTPYSINPLLFNKIPELLFGSDMNSDFTWDAMSVNDNDLLTREDRENKLIELFKEEGITLEFVGNY